MNGGGQEGKRKGNGVIFLKISSSYHDSYKTTKSLHFLLKMPVFVRQNQRKNAKTYKVHRSSAI
jgi:hypothetical protein